MAVRLGSWYELANSVDLGQKYAADVRMGFRRPGSWYGLASSVDLEHECCAVVAGTEKRFLQ